jgi:hypothetical protein
MTNNKNISVGDVVQIDPSSKEFPMFAGFFLLVTKMLPNGVEAYYLCYNQSRLSSIKGYLKVGFNEIERVGQAPWAPWREEE